jgi:NAD(P)-dependent dehydrogenase (short-subunit alcohol dehydrogenase family)
MDESKIKNYKQLAKGIPASPGAASGIGKALVHAFKEAGAGAVVAVDIDAEGVEQAAQEIGGLAIAANVAKEEDIQKVIQEANDYAGGIDIFCSNAGIAGVPGFIEMETSDWQNIWEINVMSHIYAAKHVIPQMLEQGSGYLVNTASAAGLLTQLGSAGYAVSKTAAVSFAEWIKITYGNKGIGVSCLCPQAVRTAMTEQGPGVAGVDGMLEADVVANDVLDAIKEERFLVLPHQEVTEYMQRKANDRDRWIGGMQRLQKQYEDFLTPMESEEKN